MRYYTFVYYDVILVYQSELTPKQMQKLMHKFKKWYKGYPRKTVDELKQFLRKYSDIKRVKNATTIHISPKP
jgi:hypothetical protein